MDLVYRRSCSQPILELVAVELIPVAKYARAIRSAMREISRNLSERKGTRQELCFRRALRPPFLSLPLPFFYPSRSHPFRICSLFVRLPARFYLRSIFPSFISFPPQPARALFRFFLRFFALSTFIYSPNFFYSCTYAPRTEDTTWGRWAEEWAMGESGRAEIGKAIM